MKRETLQIGKYPFICDIYKNDIDVFNINERFVMFRKVVLFNNIFSDSDIYIVEKSMLNEDNWKNMIFPTTDKTVLYSKKISDFSETLRKNDFNMFYENNWDLVDEGKDVKLACDIVRIYHPLMDMNKINMIVHMDNIINGVHFHYFCKDYKKCDVGTGKEFIINNQTYTEYIEFKIPNIEKLFNGNVYFVENNCEPEINDEQYKSLINHRDNSDLCSMKLFTIPYKISDTEEKKVYLPETEKTIENTYLSYPVNITLYPYNSVNNESLYYLSPDYDENSDVFQEGVKIKLASKLSFNSSGKISVISEFKYPNPENFSSVKEAYEYYNNISIRDYNTACVNEGNCDYIEDENNENQCIRLLILASDTKFKHIINTIKHEDNDIDNFSFDIPLFSDWNQMPELLVCKTIFIDRYLGINYESNYVIITAEQYKYLVYNAENIFRLDMNNDKFDFIDKINCIIEKNVTDNSSTLSNNGINKIFYKPIFFKVQDLQNIKIRFGLTQNIGVNLGNYMTKVDTFKLIINGNEFIESARNDSFVIFKINANLLTNANGTYHITNQDDEYISSGAWTIIS